MASNSKLAVEIAGHQDAHANVQDVTNWLDKIDSLPWRRHISDLDARAYVTALAHHPNQEEAKFHAGRIGALGGSEAGVIVTGIVDGASGAFGSYVDVYKRLLLKELPELNLPDCDPRVIGNRIEPFSEYAFKLWYEKQHPGTKLELIDPTQQLRESNQITPYKSSPDGVWKIVGTDEYVLVDYKAPMWTQRETSEFFYSSTKGIMDDYLYQINLYRHDLEANGFKVRESIVFQCGFENAAGVLQMIDRFDKAGKKDMADEIRRNINEQIEKGVAEDNPDLIRISAHTKPLNKKVVELALLSGRQFMSTHVMKGVPPALSINLEKDAAKAAHIDAVGVQYKVVLAAEKVAKDEKSRLTKMVKGVNGKTNLANIKTESVIDQKKLAAALKAAGVKNDGWQHIEELHTYKEVYNEELLVEAAKRAGINVENYSTARARISPARTKDAKPTMKKVEQIAIDAVTDGIKQAKQQVARDLGMPQVAEELAVKPAASPKLAELAVKMKQDNKEAEIAAMDDSVPDMI